MKTSHVTIRRWVATVVVLAALAGGAVLATGLRNWSGVSVLGAPRVPLAIAHDTNPVELGTLRNGFASVLKPILPAVVNINTSRVVKSKAGENSPLFNDPFFRQFFGDQAPQSQQPHNEREQSLGSGVIISPDGTIITNNHVIDGATDIKVQLADKREFQAKLVGTDAKTDVAVLKIDASNLPTVALGDSSRLEVGDVVLAIGDPFGVGETATMGIVSATGRGGLGIEGYEDFIQTDASINPGNSGGALVDLHGNLVGINTAILSGEGGGNQGIGFAIPVNMAHHIMDQLIQHGKVVRGYLGVYIQPVTPDIAKQFHLSENHGALIGDVTPDTPGAKAGLKRGDVILALDGHDIADANQLRLEVSQMSPGADVKLQVSRDGKVQDMTVKLGELPETAEKTAGPESSSGALEGVEVQNLTPDVSGQLNLPAGTHGVVVTQVDPSSAAAAAGLDRGVVIQEVNHKPVNNVDEYKQALAAGKGQPVLLLVNHGGVTQFVVVEPQ